MVVIGAPALAEKRVRALPVAVVEEILAIDVDAGDCDAEILLPLRCEVVADRLVEWVGVERVREAFDLRSIRVPSHVLGLRGCRSELCVGIGVVAEIALQTPADQPAGGRDTRGPLA